MQEEQNEQKDNALDALVRMAWENEVGPLIAFLNCTVDQITELHRESELRGKLPFERILHFHGDLSSILAALSSLAGEKQIRGLEDLLSAKLANIENRVSIGENLHIEVQIKPSGLIDQLWCDFAFVFLARDWRKVLGRCLHCERWFQRNRRDRLYCTDSCRVKAHYQRAKRKKPAYKRSYKGKAV